MRKEKLIFTSLVILLAFLFQGMTVCAMNTGFSTQTLSNEEENTFKTNIYISFLDIEPDKRPIDCFDVNENGLIAVGSSVAEQKTITIYDSKGVFRYGYEFDCNGMFGIEWDNDNIIIYFLRSDVACSVSSTGEIEEILKIENTQENNYYWNNCVFSTSRTVGDCKYIIKNNMGLFNIFASSYSQLEIMDSNGKINVFYDVNSYQFSKMIIVFVCVLVFIGTVIYILVRQFDKIRQRTNTRGRLA